VQRQRRLSALRIGSKEQNLKVAILDDYQSVALYFAVWSSVADRTEIMVFEDHVAASVAAWLDETIAK
jgi:hypothetical protein